MDNKRKAPKWSKTFIKHFLVLILIGATVFGVWFYMAYDKDFSENIDHFNSVDDNISDATIIYNYKGDILKINKKANSLMPAQAWNNYESLIEYLGIPENEGSYKKKIGNGTYESRSLFERLPGERSSNRDELSRDDDERCCERVGRRAVVA